MGTKKYKKTMEKPWLPVSDQRLKFVFNKYIIFNVYYWVIQTVVLHHRSQQRKTEESFLAYQTQFNVNSLYLFMCVCLFVGRRVEKYHTIKIYNQMISWIYEQSTS